MRLVFGFVLFALVLPWSLPAIAFERLTLTAADGLPVTADVYRSADPRPTAPWIVLAHMAGASRGEYREIAPRLNRLGYNAIALDQRSGSGFGGVANETAAAARAAGKARDFLSAVPDIDAGIAYARSRTHGTVLLWGSSYSAALALLLAGERPGLVDGVIAASPGEYLTGHSVAGTAARIAVPVLIVSPTAEAGQWRAILDAIPHSRKRGFVPVRGGLHGSSSFIPSQSPGAAEYWRSVETFLGDYFGR